MFEKSPIEIYYTGHGKGMKEWDMLERVLMIFVR